MIEYLDGNEKFKNWSSFIHHHQNLDQALLKALKEDHHFSRLMCESLSFIHFKSHEAAPPKNVIPQALQYSTVSGYTVSSVIRVSSDCQHL